MENFTVIATIEVRAENKDAAMDCVANTIRRGYEKGSGMNPVGNFDAHPGAWQLDKAFASAAKYDAEPR